jgi:hypothetical protein
VDWFGSSLNFTPLTGLYQMYQIRSRGSCISSLLTGFALRRSTVADFETRTVGGEGCARKSRSRGGGACCCGEIKWEVRESRRKNQGVATDEYIAENTDSPQSVEALGTAALGNQNAPN